MPKVTIELPHDVAEALRRALGDPAAPTPEPTVPPTSPPAPEPAAIVTLEANADPYSSPADPGPWPIVHLFVAGQRVGEPTTIDRNAQAAAWKSVTWELAAAPADDATVAIRFANDAADPKDWAKPGNDRNLHVRRIVIAVPGREPIELKPEQATYRGDDGTVTRPASSTMFRAGQMVWREPASSTGTVYPTPLPVVPGRGDIYTADRKRLAPLDPSTVPFEIKPKFLRHIFVDADRGRDDAPGDERRPLKTIDQAKARARQLGPGTCAVVRQGVYDFGGASFSWDVAGGREAWSGLVGYPGERPKLRNRGWECLRAGASFVVLEGFDLDGSRVGYTSPWTGRRIDSDEQFDAECRDRINNRTHEPSGWDSGGGIAIDGGMSGTEQAKKGGIHHVVIRDMVTRRWPGSGLGSAGMDYILVEDLLAQGNCKWMGWGASAISIYGPRDCGSGYGNERYRIVVRRTVSNDCIQYKNTFDQDKVSDGGAIQCDLFSTHFNYPHRALICSNIAYDNGQSGFHSTSSRNVDWIGNTSWMNNKLPQNQGGGSEIWAGWNDAKTNGFFGNIAIGRNKMPAIRLVDAGKDQPEARDNIVNVASPFPGSIVADPKFVRASTDPALADFRIAPDSPAVGRGDPRAGHDVFGRTKARGDAGAIWVFPDAPASSPPPPVSPPAGPTVSGGQQIEVRANRLTYGGRDLRLIGPCLDALLRADGRSIADQRRAVERAIDHMADEWGANVLRVHLYPSKWRALCARGDGWAYLDAMRGKARSRGMWWMVDNHVVGAPDGPVSDWQDKQDGRVDWALELATELGRRYGDDPSFAAFVGWDEPIMPSGQFAWAELAPVHQRILDAFRAAGGRAVYVANGTHWARIYRGWRDAPVRDPLGRLACSFHDFEKADRLGGEWQNFDQFLDGIHETMPLFLVGLSVEPVDAAAPDPDYAAWLDRALALGPSVNPWGDAWVDPKAYVNGWPNDVPTEWNPMGRWLRDKVRVADLPRLA